MRTVPVSVELLYKSNGKVRYHLKYPDTATGQDLMHASFGILVSFAEMIGIKAEDMAQEMVDTAKQWDAAQAKKKEAGK